MCGIVGMAGDVSQGHRKSFHDMLLVCQLRGRDSTGAIRVPFNDKAVTAKAIGTPDILLQTKRYDQNIDGFGKAFIGHCRHKTMGAANYENAHPFEHGSLTGVHNGTLRSVWGMPKANDFGTDSEWLYWMASEEGMANVLPEIDFCGALVWWDEEDKTLNFFRNEERTLWVTYSEDLKTMLWASEIGMFWPFSRNYKLWDGGKDERLYVQVEPNKIFSYKIANHGKTANDIFTLKITDVPKKEVRRYSGNVNRNSIGSGSGNGGSVPAPFDQGVRRTLNQGGMSLYGEGWDDNLDDIGRENPEPLLLPPVRTNIQGASTTTPNSGKKSSESLLKDSVLGLGKNGSKSGEKQTLSLVLPNSNSSRRGSKDVTVTDFVDCSGSSPPPQQVSLRTVLGVPMISCKNTSREWTEQEFDEATEGKCCFCKDAIGGLEEVNKIFVNKNKQTKEEKITFVCQPCVKSTVLI